MILFSLRKRGEDREVWEVRKKSCAGCIRLFCKRVKEVKILHAGTGPVGQSGALTLTDLEEQMKREDSKEGE